MGGAIVKIPTDEELAAWSEDRVADEVMWWTRAARNSGLSRDERAFYRKLMKRWQDMMPEPSKATPPPQSP